MMVNSAYHPVLLIAEDNPDDRLLIEYAWSVKPHVQLFLVEHGEAVIDFLNRQGEYTATAACPCPSLILLDLRMPRKNGFEVLADLKTHPVWQVIPIVVMTTSATAADVERAYALGANSYISKPQTIEEILALADLLDRYWFSVVTLPTAM